MTSAGLTAAGVGGAVAASGGAAGAWGGALLALLLLGATGTAESPDLALAALAREWLVGALLGVSALGPAAAIGAAAWALGAGAVALVRRRRQRSRWREVERMERAMYAARRKRRSRS